MNDAPHTATTPDGATDLLAALTEGDRIEFAGDTWKVLDVTENDRGTPFVKCRAVTGHNPGTKTIYPSSGFENSAVTTKSRGVGAYYSEVRAVEVEAFEGEDDGDDGDGSESVRFEGVVRSLAEQEANAAFSGNETAAEVLGRTKTQVVVHEPDEAKAVIEVLGQVGEGRDLTFQQERALRRVRGELREAVARLGGVLA